MRVSFVFKWLEKLPKVPSPISNQQGMEFDVLRSFEMSETAREDSPASFAPRFSRLLHLLEALSHEQLMDLVLKMCYRYQTLADEIENQIAEVRFSSASFLAKDIFCFLVLRIILVSLAFCFCFEFEFILTDQISLGHVMTHRFKCSNISSAPISTKAVCAPTLVRNHFGHLVASIFAIR